MRVQSKRCSTHSVSLGDNRTRWCNFCLSKRQGRASSPRAFFHAASNLGGTWLCSMKACVRCETRSLLRGLPEVISSIEGYLLCVRVRVICYAEDPFPCYYFSCYIVITSTERVSGHGPRDWREHLYTSEVNDLVNHNSERGWTPNELRDWLIEHLQRVNPNTKNFR